MIEVTYREPAGAPAPQPVPLHICADCGHQFDEPAEHVRESLRRAEMFVYDACPRCGSLRLCDLGTDFTLIREDAEQLALFDLPPARPRVSLVPQEHGQ